MLHNQNISVIQNNRINEWTNLGVRLLQDQDLIEKIRSEMIKLNSSQPYHNYHHMMAVALRANQILLKTIPESNTRDKMARVLYLAASFHDIGHSAGTLTDKENISYAMRKIGIFWGSAVYHFTMSYISVPEIISAIECTEFPFVKEPVSLIDMCLRDADLMMALESDYQFFIDGLSVKLNADITLEDTIEFLKQKTFYTYHGKELIENFIKDYQRKKDES